MKISKKRSNIEIKGNVTEYWEEVTGARLEKKNHKRSRGGGEVIDLGEDEDKGKP